MLDRFKTVAMASLHDPRVNCPFRPARANNQRLLRRYCVDHLVEKQNTDPRRSRIS